MTVKMEVDLSLDHQIKIKRLPIGVHKINSLFLETLIRYICALLLIQFGNITYLIEFDLLQTEQSHAW